MLNIWSHKKIKKNLYSLVVLRFTFAAITEVEDILGSALRKRPHLLQVGCLGTRKVLYILDVEQL